MKGCDTFLMVGSAFPYSESLPKPGAARGVQIDIEGNRLSLRYPMEVNPVGDSKTSLRALLPMLTQKKESPWRRGIERGVKEWWETLEKRAMASADPLNPQRVFWELSPRLPDNAIITADSGSVANWYARHLKMRRGMKASLSGGLASLGAGMPYAIAGKMAYADSAVIACMGDGAMQMNGINVMITNSKYWKQWSNPRLIVLRDLNQVTWEERIQLGAGKTESTQSIPDFPYHKYGPFALLSCRSARPQAGRSNSRSSVASGLSSRLARQSALPSAPTTRQADPGLCERARQQGRSRPRARPGVAEQLRARWPANLHGRPDRPRGRPAGPGSRTISRMNGPRGEASDSPSSEHLWCRVRMEAFAIGSDAPGHDRRDSFS